MKQLELIDKKNPFEAFTAEEVNKILDAIGVSYDSAVESHIKPEKVVCDFVVSTKEMKDTFAIETEVPIVLREKPLKLGVFFYNDNPEPVSFSVRLSKNGNLEEEKTVEIDSKKTVVMTHIFEEISFGVNEVAIAMNTNGQFVHLNEVVWGW